MRDAFSGVIEGSLQILPWSKDMCIRLICDSRLSIGVNVSVKGSVTDRHLVLLSSRKCMDRQKRKTSVSVGC